MFSYGGLLVITLKSPLFWGDHNKKAWNWTLHDAQLNNFQPIVNNNKLHTKLKNNYAHVFIMKMSIILILFTA